MTHLERKAIRALIQSMTHSAAAKPEHLDLEGYDRGYQYAARHATDILSWLMEPPKRRDLVLYARQALPSTGPLTTLAPRRKVSTPR